MLVAINEIQEENLAWLTEKSQGPFSCPECKSEVILRKGKVRAHHFAHKPPINCIYGVGESQKHLIVKRQIYEALLNHPNCSRCQLERRLKGVRPDISLYVGDTRVAIEIQKSPIDIDDIYRRTQRYTELDVYLLWILPDDSPLTFFHKGEETDVHRIKEWEKYLHAIYWGRVYYWQRNALVSPYHFDKFETWVEESNWYSEDGDEMSAGGYYRETKSLKVPSTHNELHIADDFQPITRPQWSAKNWTVPNAKLWIDTSQKWW
ncbi:competence protein CoiA family protein [Desulfobacterales bacterium HSG2]|nr:competence protein CoiA family protein [Desulfobacterales bacterium HSG2]